MIPTENEIEQSWLRSQLEIARQALAKALEENAFLKRRLILEQIDRAFEKAGGNPEFDSGQIRSTLQSFGDVELFGGEVGFRQKGARELMTLTEAMELIRKISAIAPLFAPQAAAPEQRIFKNEFGSFRKI